MSARVFYLPFGDDVSDEAVAAAASRVFQEATFGSRLVRGRPVAVKTHFGERGNDSYLPPTVVRAVVDEVRSAGGEPCLVETSTLYRGRRSNAVDHFNLALAHGFGPERMGCPLLFLDGLRGNLHVEQRVELKHFDTVAVAGDFTLIPSAVICSHVTGHMLGGFGGAIKNVAMGLASRAGKLRQHSAGRPQIRAEDCIACGTCAEWCPEDAITVPEKAEIDYECCIGCGECAAVCPVGAVGFGWDEPARSFNEKMAEYAYGILRDKLDHVAFLSFILCPTKECNCEGHEGTRIGPDLGVVASADPVAVDQACIDLMNEAVGEDVFEAVWPGKHYTAQLEHGEQIGLGRRQYDLVQID